MKLRARLRAPPAAARTVPGGTFFGRETRYSAAGRLSDAQRQLPSRCGRLDQHVQPAQGVGATQIGSSGSVTAYMDGTLVEDELERSPYGAPLAVAAPFC